MISRGWRRRRDCFLFTGGWWSVVLVSIPYCKTGFGKPWLSVLKIHFSGFLERQILRTDRLHDTNYLTSR